MFIEERIGKEEDRMRWESALAEARASSSPREVDDGWVAYANAAGGESS